MTLPCPAPSSPSSALDAIDAACEAVVIGTSAGGVEALSLLLPRLGRHFAPAIVIVLHLPPDGQSEIARLFAMRCVLPVLEASDREPIRGGTVYFAPPGYHLLVNADRTCALSVDEAVNFSRPSIDVMFESAAWAYGNRLLGILLTGASADGAAGMAAIRKAGGTTWAQAPAEARATAMPLAAIERGVVDAVLTLEEIAQRFERQSQADAAVAGRQAGASAAAVSPAHTDHL
ncbi:chemotaxis protein CheB [Robbsia sp. Bb-Pol-6]|uniref:protein-glutamate methylesterase n=1 Tax=Robbsia betulipollinis TaxID=2981849 RepID=A0ABT3ZRU7_9BURK|nr:chemotaxis protein CheB [Robbsia betulipollinis]MCY0389202.1 chemotaxis protein CheB [Robbsia betulipollinis]